MVDALAAMPWKAPQSIDAYELRSSKLLPVLLTVLVLLTPTAPDCRSERWWLDGVLTAAGTE